MTISTNSRTDSRNRGVIRAESVYDTDIDDLWDACTDRERLARWIATVSGELRQGCTIDISYASSWTGPTRIDVCEPPRHLLLVGEPGTADEVETEVWLTAEGDKTRLIVEERGLDPDKAHFHAAGWRAHLEDLSTYLAHGALVHPDGWSSERSATDWSRRFEQHLAAQ